MSLLPRSPYESIHGVVYFGRMLDKIRLHAQGKLPSDYIPNLGKHFDAYCLHFLGIEYTSLVDFVAAGASDEEAWAWVIQHGVPHSEEELFIWNSFMKKRGWRDDVSEKLRQRLQELGTGEHPEIQTFFDYMDLDEGRTG